MSNDFSIAVFISGRGSNLKGLIDGAKYFRVKGVLSDRAAPAGFGFATSSSIPTYSFPRESYASLQQQKDALYSCVDSLAPDLVVLAGYMQIVRADFVERWTGRIINIHPSLLPKYPGLDTHARAIAAGDAEHGCTVHYVAAEVDAGPIIAQAVCPVDPKDTEQALAARVLTYEHRIYPWVVNSIARGGVVLDDGEVRLDERALQEALAQQFIVGARYS